MSKPEMVSVVIPTLNEAGTVGETIKGIEKNLATPKQIIVVDGGSTDGTQEIVKRNNCELIIEPKQGYGTAIKTGIRHAKGDIIVIIDGDGTYETKHINRLVEALRKEKAHLCLCSRLNGLLPKSMDLVNYLGNKMITFLFNTLYNQRLTDTQSGFRAIRRSTFEKYEFNAGDMAFATEMLIKLAQNGHKIIEVPTIYKPRSYGKSKLKEIRSGLEIFAVILKGVFF